MNQIFGEYATATAFAIMLTKRQCNTLLRVRYVAQEAAKHGVDAFGRGGCDMSVRSELIAPQPMQSLHALRDRGLVFWHRTHDGKACGFGGLTKAGELMCGLLDEAGLTIENTNTLSVLRRLDRAA